MPLQELAAWTNPCPYSAEDDLLCQYNIWDIISVLDSQPINVVGYISRLQEVYWPNRSALNI